MTEHSCSLMDLIWFFCLAHQRGSTALIGQFVSHLIWISFIHLEIFMKAFTESLFAFRVFNKKTELGMLLFGEKLPSIISLTVYIGKWTDTLAYNVYNYSHWLTMYTASSLYVMKVKNEFIFLGNIINPRDVLNITSVQRIDPHTHTNFENVLMTW